LAVAGQPVLLYTLNNHSSVYHAVGDACRVLYAPAAAGRLTMSAKEMEPFDVVFTDDHSRVPFLGVAGKFHFLEDRQYPLRDLGRQLALEKEVLPLELRRQGMSVLLPPTVTSQDLQQIVEEGMILMPGNLFVDTGTFESRQQAFANFTFTAMLNEEGGTPPQSLVDCIAHGTVPMFVGKKHLMNYTRFFPYGIVKFSQFAVESAINFMLSAPADAFYVYSNSVKMVQEFFHMRYRAPFPQRLHRHAQAACHALARPQPVLAFVSIYSAKPNFGRRMALRSTWLPLLSLESPKVVYKFFLAGTLLNESSNVDALLRQERDHFDDMVFLVGTNDEYPIGRKGFAALQWVAQHTDAQFWLKLDDDVYLRPRPLFDRFRRMQRAEAYWGAFDFSGRVVRDTNDPHYTSADTWAEDIFPPYARGAALAMSLDLVRQIALEDSKRPFKKILIEDVSYGFYIWQLVFEREVSSVTLLDHDEVHFAMDAKCCTETTHPNNCWLPLDKVTWIVHHASPEILRCMHQADVDAGYYRMTGAKNTPSVGVDDLIRQMLPYDSSVRSALNSSSCPRSGVDGISIASSWEGALPDLCGCVVTPPAHPGKPLQKGGLQELSMGPRLHAV